MCTARLIRGSRCNHPHAHPPLLIQGTEEGYPPSHSLILLGAVTYPPSHSRVRAQAARPPQSIAGGPAGRGRGARSAALDAAYKHAQRGAAQPTRHTHRSARLPRPGDREPPLRRALLPRALRARARHAQRRMTRTHARPSCTHTRAPATTSRMKASARPRRGRLGDRGGTPPLTHFPGRSD